MPMFVFDVSANEILFRMSQILERLQISLDSAAISTRGSIERFKEAHSESLERWLEIVQRLEQNVMENPLVVRCQDFGNRAFRAFYAKCLPIFAEMSRNSLLACFCGFLAGYLIGGYFSRRRKLTKDKLMKGLTYDDTSSCGIKLTTSIIQPKICRRDEVLVKVLFVAVDPSDLLKAKSSGSSTVIEKVPGRDFVGEVVDVGLSVEHVDIGQHVCGVTNSYENGTMVEYLVLRGSQVYIVPDRFTLESAAVFPFSSLKVLHGLVRVLNLKPYDCEKVRALVIDGTSATGILAIQILKAWGAEVTSCVQYNVVPLAKILGSLRVFPAMASLESTEESLSSEFLTEPRFNFVVNTNMRMVSINFCKKHVIHGSHVLILDDNDDEECNEDQELDYTFFPDLINLLENGELQPVVDSTFNLVDFEAAFRRASEESLVAKCVIKIARQ